MSSTLQNKIFRGEVAAVHNYGAFVKIPGEGQKQGLVHKSQISVSHVDDATEVLEVNEKIWCKVISVQEDGKVGLSMKVVDQGTGTDLDPNNVQISLDAKQRKEKVYSGETKAITLEAIYKTTCTKCGVTGHLSKNCFQRPDSSTSYSLIPEPEEEKKIFGTIQDRLKRLAGIAALDPARETEEPKKRKLSEEDSSSDSGKVRKRKKEKKHKKHKKSKKKQKESKKSRK